MEREKTKTKLKIKNNPITKTKSETKNKLKRKSHCNNQPMPSHCLHLKRRESWKPREQRMTWIIKTRTTSLYNLHLSTVQHSFDKSSSFTHKYRAYNNPTGQSATSQVNPAGISGTPSRKRASSPVVIRRNWVIVSVEGCGPLPKGVIQSNMEYGMLRQDRLPTTKEPCLSCRAARNQTLHIPQTSFPFPSVPANRFFPFPFYHLW